MGGVCRLGCPNGIQTSSLLMPPLSQLTSAALLRCDFLLLVSQTVTVYWGHVLRGGREGGSCLVSILKDLFSAHSNPPSSMGMSALQNLAHAALPSRTACIQGLLSLCLFSFNSAVLYIQLQWRPALQRWKRSQKVNRDKIHFLSLFPLRYCCFFQQVLPSLGTAISVAISNLSTGALQLH